MSGTEPKNSSGPRPGLLLVVVAVLLAIAVIVVAFNAAQGPAATATPTTDSAIYNQVPDTHVFEPGECYAILDEPTPAHTSNTLGAEPSGEIPPGRHEVGVSAKYSTSQWYALNNVGATNYVNSENISSLEGNCNVSE